MVAKPCPKRGSRSHSRIRESFEPRPSHWEATSFLGSSLIISGEDVERGIKLTRSAVSQRAGQFYLRLYEGIGYYLISEYNSAAQILLTYL